MSFNKQNYEKIDFEIMFYLLSYADVLFSDKKLSWQIWSLSDCCSSEAHVCVNSSYRVRKIRIRGKLAAAYCRLKPPIKRGKRANLFELYYPTIKIFQRERVTISRNFDQNFVKIDQIQRKVSQRVPNHPRTHAFRETRNFLQKFLAKNHFSYFIDGVIISPGILYTFFFL